PRRRRTASRLAGQYRDGHARLRSTAPPVVRGRRAPPPRLSRVPVALAAARAVGAGGACLRARDLVARAPWPHAPAGGRLAHAPAPRRHGRAPSARAPVFRVRGGRGRRRVRRRRAARAARAPPVARGLTLSCLVRPCPRLVVRARLPV